MTEQLTVEDARAELSGLERRVNELRKFLRQHTASGLTRNELLAAKTYVEAGSTQLAAARLGMRHGDYTARLESACQKLGVDVQGLAAALGVTGVAL